MQGACAVLLACGCLASGCVRSRHAPAFQLVASVPADGAEDVDVFPSVTLTFSSAIDPSSLGPQTIRLHDRTGAEVPCRIDLAAPMVVAVVPRARLDLAVPYTLLVDSPLRSTNGSVLPQRREIVFTVRDGAWGPAYAIDDRGDDSLPRMLVTAAGVRAVWTARSSPEAAVVRTAATAGGPWVAGPDLALPTGSAYLGADVVYLDAPDASSTRVLVVQTDMWQRWHLEAAAFDAAENRWSPAHDLGVARDAHWGRAGGGELFVLHAPDSGHTRLIASYLDGLERLAEVPVVVTAENRRIHLSIAHASHAIASGQRIAWTEATDIPLQCVIRTVVVTPPGPQQVAMLATYPTSAPVRVEVLPVSLSESVAVWYDPIARRMVHAASHDGTWSEPAPIPGTDGVLDSRHALVADVAAGVAFLVCQVEVGGKAEMRSMVRREDGTWVHDAVLALPGPSGYLLGFHADRHGNGFLAGLLPDGFVLRRTRLGRWSASIEGLHSVPSFDETGRAFAGTVTGGTTGIRVFE